MSRLVLAAVIFCALSSAGCESEPMAPDPETPSTQQQLTPEAQVRATQVTCGQVITESIALANDLTNCPGTGLVVGADSIVIDGRGHLVDGGPQLADVRYGVLIDGHTGVTVKNVRIREFTIGVGILNSSDSQVLRSEISGSFLDGILFMAAHDNEVAHNDFPGNGIAVNVTAGSSGNEVVHNRIVDPVSGNGIQLTDVSGTEVVGNRIQNGSLNVQSASDNVIERNRVDGALLFGYSIRGQSQRNVFRNNDVTGVSGDGFSIFGISVVFGPSDNTLIGNSASGNTGDGFDLSGATSGNTLTRNVSQGNGGFGFRDGTLGSGTAGTRNVYDQNRCRNNVAGASMPAGLCRDSDGG